MEILYVGDDGPFVIVEAGSKKSFIFWCCHDGTVHVQEAVVGVDRPVFVDVPCGFELKSTVLYLACIHVLAVDGLNHVVALYIEYVGTVCDVGELMAP